MILGLDRPFCYTIHMKKTLSQREKEKIIRFFKKRSDVVAVYLFGSQATKTTFFDSDVDLAVLLKDQGHSSSKKQIEMTVALNRLLDTEIVDIKLLSSQTSFPLIEQIFTHGQVLVDNHPDQRLIYENKMRGLLFDFQPYLNTYLNAMHRRLESRTYGTRYKTT